MKKRYEWKVLSEDGILKDVKVNYGYGHYGMLGGGDTEEEAMKSLQDAITDKSVGQDTYVLLTVFDSWKD